MSVVKEIEYNGGIGHLIVFDDYNLCYENIIKNYYSNRVEFKPGTHPWYGDFIVKKFDLNGNKLVEYMSVDTNIFKRKEIVPLVTKYHPELIL